MSEARVQITGLQPLVRQLRGPAFRDVNRELRAVSKLIATDLLPEVRAAVAASGAPQAAAMAATTRVHSDRVPVVAVGKVNPKFTTKFRGGDTKRRRGSLAHGVVYGPLGGKKTTPAHENYYRVGRDPSGGALGASMRTGPIYDRACEAYLKQWLAVMKHHGFLDVSGNAVTWGG
jgi:hypothetical protein